MIKRGDRVRTKGSKPGDTGYDVGTVTTDPYHHKVRVYWHRAKTTYDEYTETLEKAPGR